MLTTLYKYKPNITLIENSGIQFINFGLSPSWHEHHAGCFVRKTANGPLLRLSYDVTLGKFSTPAEHGKEPEWVKPELTLSLSHSLKLLNKIWLPLPFLRNYTQQALTLGPDNWARVQICTLDAPDQVGNTVRVNIAFDTKIVTNALHLQAPTADDISNGTRFSLAWQKESLNEFLDQTWVDGWLREVFCDFCREKELRTDDEIARAIKLFEYQGHYLNILDMLGKQLTIPEVKVVTATLHSSPIPVDLVLDVGNTHTCGILIEDHGRENNALQQTAELQIRSLTEPHIVSPPIFTSRMAFSEAKFGKQHFSFESGRSDAFVWPSMVRVGNEAHHLAYQRLGTEGESGISSPRRYLWDNNPSQQNWRFSQPDIRTQREPQAISFPLMSLINDDGQPLFSLPIDERFPVFSAQYSRSSLMTLMLCELLAQALMQMNSVCSRQKMNHATAPRQLRNIILTLPSAMPKPERELFRQRMQEAIGLVWKALGWHPVDDNFTSTLPHSESKRPIPTIQLEWDEATCGQLVWLYNEALVNYAGKTDLFFATLARPDRPNTEATESVKTLRVASVDIGGGTTDMAIVQYQLDEGYGHNVKITPRLLFREGFKIAGDDVLLDIIQQYVLPALENALQQAGIADTSNMMNILFGKTTRQETQVTLRQQTTLQLLIPLGHTILSFWERYGENTQEMILDSTIGELLPRPLSENVINYIEQIVQQAQGVCSSPFDLMAVPLLIEISELQNAWSSGKFALNAPLQSLCEVIDFYYCDVLLVTGRPAALPGIKTQLQQFQPVPVNRIVWLDNYQTPAGCPFSAAEASGNPKSTAVVGAMLYSLAGALRLPHFNFSTVDIKAYSTVRYLGMLEDNNVLTDENIWYRDIDLDDSNGELDKTLHFSLRGNIRLGFRQLDNVRWPATPLFSLSIISPQLAKAIAGHQVLNVTLKQTKEAASLTLAKAWLSDGTLVPLEQLSFKLNTLTNSESGSMHYWIDNGSVYQ